MSSLDSISTSGVHTLSDGVEIAYRMFGRNCPDSTDPDFIPVLLFHGWCDNSNSFIPLIQTMIDRQSQPEKYPASANLKKVFDSQENRPDDKPLHTKANYCFVAVDFAGHGLSSHLNGSAYYTYYTHVAQQVEFAVKHLQWSRFNLIAHSMGGAIGAMMASVVPERILSFISFDSVTFWTYPPENSPLHLATVIQRRLDSISRPVSRRRFASLDEAIEKYRVTNPFIKIESAKLLLDRGMKPANETDSNDNSLVFRHDPRLNDPTAQVWLDNQVPAFLTRIQCPVLFFVADRKTRKAAERKSKSNEEQSTTPGDPNSNSALYSEPVSDIEQRFRSRIPLFKNIQVYFAPGDHHFHLDDPELIVNRCIEFIENSHHKRVAKM